MPNKQAGEVGNTREWTRIKGKNICANLRELTKKTDAQVYADFEKKSSQIMQRALEWFFRAALSLKEPFLRIEKY
ncbi:MAG: hypothetical protein A2Y00_10040 [Omnitrophica WOR_2 bacterium GWF2_43_52]|nr:MAG: hypothetical protein A2062_07805 [Omnitrophica WOR_2 bacterium GWA2_44_7]OGX15823.1 MAG: hypothetical protein A2Y01_02575 [Omnitrophica WOR_2 bacterium GWC2_44_8]OGX21570.1 MAG: hypothetical protein A2Y00_10040 [Omnitrophica WOR_2 bacterium GWF2_43_52]HAH19456.1 hypothetical protein [Candidatus Omnitrophota bacterium]HBG63827.1 hypothetical protein [Candidatus Omnitrophota bacterium]